MKKPNIILSAIGLLFSGLCTAQTDLVVTRIEGEGNMGRDTRIIPGQLDSLISGGANRIYHLGYEPGRAPIEIQVIEAGLFPTNSPVILKLLGTDDTDNWIMYQIGASDTVYSSSSIEVGDLQIISQWGIAVSVKQVSGYDLSCEFIISGTIEENGVHWLDWLGDSDSVLTSALNWVRSGTVQVDVANGFEDYGDPSECFENFLDGWAPYRLVSHSNNFPSPTWDKFKPLNKLSRLAGIDLHITSDQSKWTRCAVLEVGLDSLVNIGGARRFDLRRSPSVNQMGLPDGSGILGLGWFPGFAVNVETGERLNIAFAENSMMPTANGSDMRWNPSSVIFDTSGEAILGGCHYIYVFRNNDSLPNAVQAYDQGAAIHQLLSANGYHPSDFQKRTVLQDVMWVGMPILSPGHSLYEGDLTVRLRVRRPYKKFHVLDAVQNNDNPMYSIQIYQPSAISESYGSLGIYPNPVSENMTINLRNELIEEVRIYDPQGKLVYRKDGIRTRSFNLTKPCTSSFAYVQVILENGETLVRKVLFE